MFGLFLYFQTQNIISLSFASALLELRLGEEQWPGLCGLLKLHKRRESSYMSVHSFFTGVRGVLLLFLDTGFLLHLVRLKFWTSAILIGVSCLIFLKLSSDEN